MSFAIVKIIDNKIFIHSDTLITGSDIDRPNIENQTISKVALIHHQLALLFAGNVEVASDLIEELRVNLPKTITALITIICTHQKKHGFTTDYVVVTTIQNKPRIYEIKDGQVKDKVNSAWVGSKAAFNRFQSEFSKEKSKGINESISFSNAFRTVFEDDSIPDVGGFRLSLVQSTQQNLLGFPETINFTSEIYMANSINQNFWESYGYWNTIKSKVSEGAYSCSNIPSMAVKNAGVGLYFGYANFGMLFSFKSFGIYPKIFKHVSSINFANEAKKYGMHLVGQASEGEGSVVQILT